MIFSEITTWAAENMVWGLLRCSVMLALATLLIRWLTKNDSVAPSTQKYLWIGVLLLGSLPFTVWVPIPNDWKPSLTAFAQRNPESRLGIENLRPTESPLFAREQTQATFPAHIHVSSVETPSGESLADPRWVRPSARYSWPLIATLVWLTGVVVFAARLIWIQYRFTKHANACRDRFGDDEEDEWKEQFQSVCSELQIVRPVDLVVTQSTGPCLATKRFRCVIMIPQGFWRQLTLCERESILRHELAHVVANDLAWLLMARVLLLIQWFNPFAWHAMFRFQQACEISADETAVSENERYRTSLARVLLRLSVIDQNATTQYSTQLHPAATGQGVFAGRVRRILRPHSRKESLVKRQLAITGLATLLCLGVLRPNAIGQNDPQDDRPALKEDAATTADHAADKTLDVQSGDQSIKDDDSSPPTGLPNTSFENVDSKGNPAGWFATRVPRNQGHYLMQRDVSIAHSGSASVSISIGAEYRSKRLTGYNWMTSLAHWKPETDYKLTGWIRTQNTVRSPVIITQCWKGNKIIGFGTTAISHQLDAKTDWTEVGYRFRVPSGTERVVVRAVCSDLNRGGTVWFDDITIVADSQANPAPVTPAEIEQAMEKHRDANPRWDALDGSFEKMASDTGKPTQWTPFPAKQDHISLSRTDEHAAAGKHSLKIQFEHGSPKSADAHWTANVTDLKPGTIYRLSIKTKTRNVKSEPRVGVHLRRSRKAMASTLALLDSGGEAIGTKDWMTWGGEFLVPAEATFATIFLHLPSEDNAGATVWFDDLTIKPVATL